MYLIAGGSARTRLSSSRSAGLPFEIEMDDGTKIPLLIKDFNELRQPIGSTKRFVHAEAKLHPTADEATRKLWSGRHNLELTFEANGDLIGRYGQV